MAAKKIKIPFYWMLLVLALFVGILYWQSRSNDPEYRANTGQSLIPTNTILSYTKHAKCRMACRGITEEEIREVLAKGKINNQKSDKNDQPCPTIAIESRVKDGQMLRIVFGICGNDTKVITCIDLEQKYDCDCS